MPSLVETVRMMQAEAISAAQKKKIAAIEKDKKLSDKERFKQIDAVMNEAKMKCPECDGKGCDHCDNKGSHDMEESKGAALAKKLAKASASSEKGKKAVTLKKAPWEKKNEDNTNDKSDDGEGMDKVQPKALKKKFDDRKDKDIDNDGDEDDSDEYLHNRRKTISKAVKEEVELDEKVNAKAIQKAVDDGKSMDAIMTMFANKRTTNTDEIRKVVKDYMWKKRMKKEEVGLDEADEYTDDEVEMKKAPAKKKKGKEDPKNKSGEEVDVEPTLDEAQEMTPEQEKMREKYVMKLKGRMDEFKKKYGDRAEKVMYATATKMAMKK